MTKEVIKFEKFYKELARKVLKYKNNSSYLVELLKNLKNAGIPIIRLKEKDTGEDSIELKEIDPFSFFANFNRGIKYNNRIKILEYLKKEMKITSSIPTDFDGIPVLNNQRSWFFSYKEKRKENDISLLWTLFEELINDRVLSETFNKCLEISGVKYNITIAFFWLYPDKYIALDKNTISYLQKELNLNESIDIEKMKYEGYIGLLKKIKFHFKDKSIYEIVQKSYEQDETTIDLRKENRKIKNKESEVESEQTLPLNKILYGPPGTGKTYHTINKALEIILSVPDSYCKIETDSEKEVELVRICKESLPGAVYENIKDEETRKILKAAFDYYKLPENGQIVFTTFHQSYGYEDFVEGIKANTEEISENVKIVTYDIEPGVLKQLCTRAKKIESSSKVVDWDSPSFFKMSLGGKNRPDIHDWCIENNFIALGYGGPEDLSEFTKINIYDDFKRLYTEKYSEQIKDTRYPMQAVNMFLKMKKNDIVVISRGNNVVDAVGIVKSDYFWNDQNQFDFYHFRKVEWIAKDLNTSPSRFIKKNISQATIYQFFEKDIIKEAFKELTATKSEEKNYVLIIDEINRGNISKIFGELITLIEDSKRLGNPEELKVKLPYSGDEFGVPNNLYIIGTMNTADRSIALMDTALRRRFQFEEMMPKSELIPEIIKVKEDEVEHEIKLQEMLKKINERIEYLYDRDHMIGHSEFMEVKTKDDLDRVFKNKVIPLLQEYFYDDWEKIQIVLGDHFKQFINYQSLFSKDEKHKLIKSEEDEVFRNENFNEDLKNEYRFIQSKKSIETKVLGFDHDDIEDDKTEYKINDNFEPECYKKIYEVK